MQDRARPQRKRCRGHALRPESHTPLYKASPETKVLVRKRLQKPPKFARRPSTEWRTSPVQEVLAMAKLLLLLIAVLAVADAKPKRLFQAHSYSQIGSKSKLNNGVRTITKKIVCVQHFDHLTQVSVKDLKVLNTKLGSFTRINLI